MGHSVWLRLDFSAPAAKESHLALVSPRPAIFSFLLLLILVFLYHQIIYPGVWLHPSSVSFVFLPSTPPLRALATHDRPTEPTATFGQATLPSRTMLFKYLNFVAAATAVAITPQLPEHEMKAVELAWPEVAKTPMSAALSRTLTVPCPKCPGENAELQFSFTIQKSTKLACNGFEVYPDADPFHGDLQARLYAEDGPNELQKLGYSIATVPLTASDPESRLQVVDVTLRVVEVGSLFVDDIPTIIVRMVELPTGETFIGNIETVEQVKNPCTTALCRLGEKFDTLWASFEELKSVKFWDCTAGDRSCIRRMAWSISGTASMDRLSGDKVSAQGQKILGRPREWTKLIKQVSSYVFLPVLFGITGGILLAWYVCTVSFAIYFTNLTGFQLLCIHQYCATNRVWKATASRMVRAPKERLSIRRRKSWSHEQPPRAHTVTMLDCRFVAVSRNTTYNLEARSLFIICRPLTPRRFRFGLSTLDPLLKV